MADLPTIITEAGLTPTSVDTLRSNIVAYAEANSAGITTDLPGTLIEDLTSTSVGSLAQIDQARVEAVNSVTPYGCNDALLDQMGYITGISRGGSSNTSAYVVFTGTAGYTIAPGFVVSDGSNEYTTQESATIGTNGTTGNVYVLATSSGSWAVAAGSITQIVSSVPTEYTLSVTNSAAGTPGDDEESDTSYRLRIMEAYAVSCQSTPRAIKAAVGNVSGVQSRLVSVQQNSGSFTVLVGGGDPYEIAGALFWSVADINMISGSVNTITSISHADSGVVTTEYTHGLTGGSVVISGCEGMTDANGTWEISVIDNNSFSINLNTTSLPDYAGSGVLETNPRNEVVTVIDAPDTYKIPFVVPLQQAVRIVLRWDTNSTNSVSASSVASLGSPALVDYVNGVYAGQPIILYQLQRIFAEAIAGIVPEDNLTRMDFTVYIDGEEVAPETGTGIIQGDRQSYLYTTSANITITRWG